MVTPDGNKLVYALRTGEAVGFADVTTMKEEGQAPLGRQPVPMNLSSEWPAGILLRTGAG